MTEFFQDLLYVDPNGELFVRTLAGNPKWFNNFLGEHSIHEVSIPCFESGYDPGSADIGVFARDQVGSAVWISLLQVGDMLMLKHKVTRGAWIQNRREAWERMLYQWDLVPFHIRQSAPYENKRKFLSGEDQAMRPLKFPSVSVVGLLTLLLCWGSGNKAMCSFSDDAEKKNPQLCWMRCVRCSVRLRFV